MPARQPFTLLCQQLARPRTVGRADLHLHTTYSDGTYTPAQVAELARRSGLAAIAVTDHDTLDGILPAREAARNDLEVIDGVEITTEFHGKELHLLGYFIDVANQPLQDSLEALRNDRVDRFHEMVDRLRALGVTLELEDLPGAANGKTLGRRHLAEALVKSKQAATVREAFQRYLHDHARAAVPKRCLPVGEAIALVRAAGGVAAWAHPTYDCDRESLTELRHLGMQAVEVEFPSGRPSRCKALRALASELGLAVTGGSDCHGPEEPHRAVGARTIDELELHRLNACVASGKTSDCASISFHETNCVSGSVSLS
ncbi:MAG: PHP domain-containing protein [Planctomycetes bacterium]|nr:PHP domain-containing protein [Planctomycetota bacterium]